MKKNLIHIFLIQLMAFYGLYAKPTIKDIGFHGIEQVSEKQAREWLDMKENAVFDITAIRSNITKLLQGYSDAGMPFTRMDSLLYIISEDSSDAQVDIYITEGEMVHGGEINLVGVDSLRAAQIKQHFDYRTGRTLDTGLFERDLDDALTRLEKMGHPFSRFDLYAMELDSSQSSIGLTWKTSLGPQLIVKEITILGNDLTKDYVILRTIKIKPDQLYDYNKVSQIKQRLMKSGFFEQVEEPQVFWTSGNEGGLLIEVKEGNASKFDGVLGYNPGTDDEGGYLTGLVDIALGNLFGTGRALSIHWQKRDRESQDLSLHYREPWVAGWPLAIGFGFEQLIQDSTYIQRNLSVDFSFPIYDNFTAIGSVSRNEISPDSLGSYLLGIPKSRTLNAAIGLTYDTRDDRINPQNGVYYETEIESGVKTNLGPQNLMEMLELREDVNNKRLSLDVEFYQLLFKRQVLAVTLHGRQVRSNEKYIPVSDQYRLGGTRSLRGFREDQFRGSGIAWSNLEYRYIMGRRSWAFLFLDTGYYFSETQSGVNEDYKIGYGFGFRLETGLGIMGIDYGLGRGETDGLFSGMLHVGIVNEF